MGTCFSKGIRQKLFPLDDAMTVLPGHGPSTTIGWERRNNPFLVDLKGIFARQQTGAALRFFLFSFPYNCSCLGIHTLLLDARGQEASGVIEAESQNDAVGQLRQAGYFPKAIAEEGKGGKAAKALKAATRQPAAAKKQISVSIPFFERKTVKGKTLMIFTRQLATLIDAGLPLLRGLTVLAKQEPDLVLRKVIVNLAETVQGGGTFSESLAGHPRIFSKLYVNMVKAGELGGVLELVLLRLAEFQEKAQKIKNKVVSAMFYPIIVLLIAILIMGFLLVFIVPKFEAIFADMLGGKPLPALTQFVIGASTFVKSNIFIIIGAIIGITLLLKLIAKTTKGALILDSCKLRMPLFGNLTRKSSISRFSRTLGNARHQRRSHSSGSQHHSRNRRKLGGRQCDHEGARQRQRGRVDCPSAGGQWRVPTHGDQHD